MPHHTRQPRSKQKPVNPLIYGIEDFLKRTESLRDGEDLTKAGSRHVLQSEAGSTLQLADLPKRYTIYGPMLLLGPTFPTQTTAWSNFYSSLDDPERQQLLCAIAAAFCNAGQQITHIALNAPIQSNLSDDSTENENVMRSPAHLHPLHGDFGPVKLLSSSNQPKQEDFDAAFWVETSQLSGIKQVWAPRWTMFSRGNIREKARILGNAQHNPAPFPGLPTEVVRPDIAKIDVVDFYVGIGYFALPYIRRGAKRVFGWEINGWSIEGLRRGCRRNGVECEVVRVPEGLDQDQKTAVVEQVVSALRDEKVRCIAFWGDNSYAGDVMDAISRVMILGESPINVRHCNLGLLPTSVGSWKGAIQTLNLDKGGWLHIHENAGLTCSEEKKQEIVDALASLVRQIKRDSWQVLCEHVEMVKTYAPGVGHYVFDVALWPAR